MVSIIYINFIFLSILKFWCVRNLLEQIELDMKNHIPSGRQQKTKSLLNLYKLQQLKSKFTLTLEFFKVIKWTSV